MREGYTKKARFSGPFDFARVLVDGSNDYAGQVMQIINDSPHEDLPLILATLSVIVEDLTSHRGACTESIRGLPGGLAAEEHPHGDHQSGGAGGGRRWELRPTRGGGRQAGRT